MKINFRQELQNDETRYRLNNIVLYLRLFNSPLLNKASIFSPSNAPSYGMLYTFRREVTEWSFSMLAYNKHVCLLQKSKISSFLLLSNEEHVLIIELHHESLIVIMVESDANSKVHSIVLDLEVEPAKFNIERLLATIQNTQCESICDRLKAIEWSLEDKSPLPPLTLHQRLSRVLTSLLTSQAMQVSKEKPPYNLSGD